MNIIKFEIKNVGWVVTVEKDGKVAHFGQLGFSFKDISNFLQGYCENKLHF